MGGSVEGKREKRESDKGKNEGRGVKWKQKTDG